MGLWLAKNGIHLRKVMSYEHRFAEEMVERYHYDVLVSDNRFGFYSHRAKSIYMTHQRRIAFPKVLSTFEPLGMLWHASVMKHFDEVWVPDLPDFPGYAAGLSHVNHSPVPVKYVGALSRFENHLGGNAPRTYKFVAVVSGVEPARSRFESLLRKELAKRNAKSVKMVSLLFKPEALTVGKGPEYVGFEIPRKFILGYGLDLDEQARNLPDIYVLKEQ
jgi:hypothetical protein